MRVDPAMVVVLSLGLLTGCAANGAGSRAARNPPSSGTAGTIESTDPRLLAALLAERMLPGVDSHLEVARQYARLGILDAAHKRTQRALDRDPRSAAAHEMMARLWRDWGFPGRALGHAHRALYYQPASGSVQNTLGTVFDALGRTSDARAAYLRAFELDASAGWALSNLCYLEFRLGHLEEARWHCEAAIRATPALAAAHNNLGLTHAAAGDLDRAREAFLAAGDAASADYNMGVVHLAAGRYAEAAEAFEHAIEARPTYTAAKKRAHEARMRALGAEGRRQP